MRTSSILYMAGSAFMVSAVIMRMAEVRNQMRKVESDVWTEANTETSDTKESSQSQSSQPPSSSS